MISRAVIVDSRNLDTINQWQQRLFEDRAARQNNNHKCCDCGIDTYDYSMVNAGKAICWLCRFKRKYKGTK